MRLLPATFAIRAAFSCAVVVVAPGCGDRDAVDDAAFPVWRLTSEVRIDGHAHDLVPINGVAVATDGTIAIGQPQDARIRFFDASGQPAGNGGRRGAGPGEFSAVGTLGWRGDSLWVSDMALARVTLLSPTHEFARTLPIPSPARPGPADEGRMPVFTFVSPAALRPGGAMLVQLQHIAGERVPEPFRDRVTYGTIRANGEIERIATILPLTDVSLQVAGGVASVPFANRAYAGVAPDGERLVVAHAALEGADAGTLRLTSIATTGDTIFTRVLPIDRVPVPAGVRDSAVEATATRMRPSNPAMADEFVRLVRVPDYYPPLSGLVVGRDGSVWAALRVRDGMRPYLALRADGTVLGQAELPSRARIAAATADQVWTIELDEFDVGSVVRYSVDWEMDG